MPQENIDVQGHRGARGLYPENSIPGFIEALKIGVSTLELDLCITGDRQVLVSHEPFFSPEFCLAPEGKVISEDEKLDHNIYRMSYDEISQFDCGSIVHSRFPDQKKLKVRKPLLKEVFDSVESYISANDFHPVRYNLELKSGIDYDNIFHPVPSEFSDLVYDVISQHISWERVTIQSFDFRILQYFRQKYPKVELALLIENDHPWRDNVDSLGFTPRIYSCYHKLLSESIVRDLQKAGMKVIPWTINGAERMSTLINWGVDGIITDYPNIAVRLVNEDQ